MEVQDKRKLLVAIETLIKTPAQSNEETIAHTLVNFKKLIEEMTANQIQVYYTYKD